jgi:hypothetical protein
MAKSNESNKESATKANMPEVNWDDSEMASSYANVVNAFSTREEFTLLFGTNQTWSLGRGKTVDIKLSNRLVMNPLVAKRLHMLTGRLLEEYENRYGALEISGVASSDGTNSDK